MKLSFADPQIPDERAQASERRQGRDQDRVLRLQRCKKHHSIDHDWVSQDLNLVMTKEEEEEITSFQPHQAD